MEAYIYGLVSQKFKEILLKDKIERVFFLHFINVFQVLRI